MRSRRPTAKSAMWMISSSMMSLGSFVISSSIHAIFGREKRFLSLRHGSQKSIGRIQISTSIYRGRRSRAPRPSIQISSTAHTKQSFTLIMGKKIGGVEGLESGQLELNHSRDVCLGRLQQYMRSYIVFVLELKRHRLVT